MSLPPAEYKRLVSLFNAGRHAQLEVDARDLVKRYPDSGFVWTVLGVSLGVQGKDALHALQMAAKLLPGDCCAHSNLGNALNNRGQFDNAVASCRRAIEIKPDYADAYVNLGIALRGLGQLDAAVASYRRALAIKPGDAETHNNLGNALRDLRRLDEAVASYHQALAIRPDYAEAHNNLGNARRDLRQLDEAVTSYRRALAIMPDYTEAHNNLGNALRDLGQLDQALASYRHALAITPGYAEAYCNLGSVLQDLGQLDAAMESFHQALAIKPEYADAHYNLGNALRSLGRLDDALISYRRALEINPHYVEAHNNLGSTLKELGQIEAAMASFRRAMAINSDYAEAPNNLGGALQDIGQLDASIASYRHALAINPDYFEVHSNLLFTHNYLADQTAAMLLSEALQFNQRVAQKARTYTGWENRPEPDRCLRVGFVSGDLRSHPVGYFVEGAIAALASRCSGRLELIAYANSSVIDGLSERIRRCCHGWHSVAALSDEALGRKIRDDGIDILIDLSGHTAHNRLPMFGWKPAPVQVSWLGYFATTGLAAMDYFIADPWTLPETLESHFSEAIWRLPETRLCFSPPDIDVALSPLPALSNGHITFGCFNTLTKMNDRVVALWALVLAAVPDSRLFLKAKQFEEASVRKNTIDRFTAHGINADRLVLEKSSPRADYLAAYQRVDIALDPFPFPGGTTTVEGLWMGVPVLTLPGESFLSRQGVGMLMNAGLPDWIAADADDYVALAVRHANDLSGLAELRAGLRTQVLASPLFDAPRFAAHFETALRGMWRRWCEQSASSLYRGPG